jgi:polar amino acid transport system substrate-binding protein
MRRHMTAFAYLIEPPFNYRNHDGTITGCDVELARTVLGMIGFRDVELIEAEFAQLLPGLRDGRWRMTTGLFATEERRQLAAFSRPIWALPDGLLVTKGNPFGLMGYRTVARTEACMLAVIRDQIQHRTAIELDVPNDRILIFETYGEAAGAVLDGRAIAYASVARAHSSFIEQRDDLPLEVVTVGVEEKEPAVGCFGFGKSDDAFMRAVDGALATYLGSREHRSMMSRFGFSEAEIDLIAP